ncbi:hypothetical protein ACX0G9_05900 [Flavitalea flava]
MYLSTVTLYEFGQFLQILVWIFIPMFVITALITTYIHYRRKRREGGENELPLALANTDQVLVDDDYSFKEEAATPYQGLLWMKNKYEQYQEQADSRVEQLKEKLKESEKKVLELKEALEEGKKSASVLSVSEEEEGMEEAKNAVNKNEPGTDTKEENRMLRERISELASVQDLIAEKDIQIDFLQNQLEQRIKNYHLVEYQGREDKSRIGELLAQLNGLQEEITGLQRERDIIKIQVNDLKEQTAKTGQLMTSVQELQDLLESEKDKTRDLTLKLQNNSGLLMNIYNELDRSLREEKEIPIPVLLEQE